MNIEKYQLGDYHLIHYQILHMKIASNVQQTVWRITKEILAVEGLMRHCSIVICSVSSTTLRNLKF